MKAKIALILVAIMLSSILLMSNSSQAQTSYKNLQDGGSILLPTGVTADHT